MVTAFWQGPAWAYVNVAAMTHSLPAESLSCFGMPSLDGHSCNDCCGSGVPSCQVTCDLLGGTAVSLDSNRLPAFSSQRATQTHFRDAPIVSRDAAPPFRPPIR